MVLLQQYVLNLPSNGKNYARAENEGNITNFSSNGKII